MLLINRITISELNNYRKEFLECLNNNISNTLISKIIIYVDDPKHDIPKISSKVDIYFKKTDSIVELIENSKRINSRVYIIYSKPLCQFNSDLFKVIPELNSNIITDNSNYFIFKRDITLSNVKDLDGIFPLNRKNIDINVKKTQMRISEDSSRKLELDVTRKTSKIIREVPLSRRRQVKKKKFVKDLGNPKIIKRKGVLPEVVNLTNENRKLDVVIVSVNYNDLLIVSLESNIRVFENITVVTSSDDLLCHKICQRYGVNCIITDVMYDEDATFNKGKAINEGIKSLKDPDFILLIDADIIVNEKIDIRDLDRDKLYTSNRWICKSFGVFNKWKKGEIDIDLLGRNEPDKGIGFFQLFNYSNDCIDKNQVYPIMSNNAAWSDLVFRDKFRKREKIDNTIIHLGDPYKNWDGRVTNRFLSDDEFGSILNKKSTFTICSFYFNYNNDWRQKRNFIKFLEQWKDYYDNMIVGVVDYGDIDFEIPCEKIVIEGNVNKRIWSKEIIINKIVSRIDTDYILWIDGDLIYENLDWLDNLDKIIESNDFVQLFETINYLGENGDILESHKSLCSGEENNVDYLLGKGFKPGGSWMTRTRLLKSKPLFEKMLVGGGDTILAYGLWGVDRGWTLERVKEGSVEVYEEAKKWISEFGKRKCGYLSVNVDHLYHGDLSDRNYNDRYKNLEKNDHKIVIFTENIGDYDTLKPIGKFKNTRCLAFIDKDIEIDGWEVININNIDYIRDLKNTKLICKYIRTHSKDLLPEHDYSIHIDANMSLLKDPNEILEEIINKDHEIMAFNHYKRSSVYEEAEQCIEWKLDNVDKIKNQINKYKEENLSCKLFECGFILRKNTESVNNFDKAWWIEIKNNSYRDQISFPYILEKNIAKFKPISHKNRMKSDYVRVDEVKRGITHKGSRIFNNNISIIYEDSRENWGSTKMRGFDISEKIKCDIIPLSKSVDIKYKKLIILKLSSYKKIKNLTDYNEIVIDMVDFNEEIHDLRIFKSFDYGIFTSKEQMNSLKEIFKYPEKCKVIYHHWDERFKDIKSKDISDIKICYFGQPEKCYKFNNFKNIDYHTIDWYDFDEKIKLYGNYNVHFAVKPQIEEDKIQPSTKISTAASLGCPVIVNRSNQNIEILGTEYPYYCDANDYSVKKVLENIEINNDDWNISKVILERVKELTSLENISKEYLNL